MTIKYRIKWRCKRDGLPGKGLPIFSERGRAQHKANALNAQNSNIATYEVEPVKVAEEEQCSPNPEP